MFDESTVRKKLKEYTEEGLIVSEKAGRQVLYSRSEASDLSGTGDLLDFFSETAPLGVVGSFLEDRLPPQGRTGSGTVRFADAREEQVHEVF